MSGRLGAYVEVIWGGVTKKISDPDTYHIHARSQFRQNSTNRDHSQNAS